MLNQSTISQGGQHTSSHVWCYSQELPVDVFETILEEPDLVRLYPGFLTGNISWWYLRRWWCSWNGILVGPIILGVVSRIIACLTITMSRGCVAHGGDDTRQAPLRMPTRIFLNLDAVKAQVMIFLRTGIVHRTDVEDPG